MTEAAVISDIVAKVYENTVNAIGGSILQSVLTNMFQNVENRILPALPVGSGAITAGDTILVAMAKLQNQTKNLVLIAGVDTVDKAPLYFTDGVLLTGVNRGAGAVEFTSNLYYSNLVLLRMGLGGVVYSSYNDAGNIFASGETDLYAYTLQPKFFFNDGDSLVGTFNGVTGADPGATKQVRLYIDGNILFDSSTFVTPSPGHWSLELVLVRSTLTDLKAMCTWRDNGGYIVAMATYTDIAANTGNSMMLTLTGEGSMADNDVIAKSNILVFHPNAQL